LTARTRRRPHRHPLFDQSKIRADLGFWAKVSYWSPDEAAALSLGYAPAFVNSCTLKPYLGASNEADEFVRRLMLVSRAIKAGLLNPLFSPSDFVNWADGIAIPLPKGLRNAVATIGALYKSSENEADELRQQIARLKEELEQCRAANREAHPRERRSLQILVAGMAAGQYGFNPAAVRSSATTEIVGDVELLGLSIDKDTVLTHLRRAFHDLDISSRQDPVTT